MPEWLKLASSTGILSGTPPSGGTYTVNVTVTDSRLFRDKNGFQLSVVVALPVGFQVENSTPGSLVFAPGNGTAPTVQAAVNGYDAGRDAGGNTVVATGTTLQRVTPVGEAISTIANAPSGSSWVAVAVDPFGNLIVGDNKTHGIWRISPDGASVAMVATYPANKFESAGGHQDIGGCPWQLHRRRRQQQRRVAFLTSLRRV